MTDRFSTLVRLCILVWFLPWAGAAATADHVDLADGRSYEGRFAVLAGVATPPDDTAADSGRAAPVLMCDDQLRRTFISKRQVKAVVPGPPMTWERIRIPQRVPENGRRISGIGGILGSTEFDPFGRRVLSLATAMGRIDVVQGITEITPLWVAVEGITTDQPIILDMRLATSSIPRETLRQVIERQIDKADADARLQIVRLLLQAERYRDAQAELQAVIDEFPGLANLEEERRRLAVLASQQALGELRLRGRAGQDRLAMQLLEAFPATDGTGEILEEVRETRDAYRQRMDRARVIVATLRERTADIQDDEARRAALEISDEIAGELGFATLDRLSVFERIGIDKTIPSDRAVALAISGWLEGAAAAQDNLKLALSTRRIRGLLRDYLTAPTPEQRDGIFRRLTAEESFDPPTVSAIARCMRPPLGPPPATAEGYHELSCPIDGTEDVVSCLVQLPPEYDPLRRYPAIVSLHPLGGSPPGQLEWWAGSAPGPGELRRGQASRHGFIVIAPAWARPGQTGYEYSAREHAAVLTSLRAVSRHFSLDSDRVFLSGHSTGGDAAWDIALSHPDLWAGLVAVAPKAAKYVNHYHRNTAHLPLYIVGGEHDSFTLAANTMDLDRSFTKGYDATYVEYRGRGHEHFSDEILRIFDWLGRKQRRFFLPQFEAVSMRPWDRFFWWIEMAGLPPRTVVLPTAWPPPPNVRPFLLTGTAGDQNTVTVRCGADDVTIWLSPELIDFDRPLTVTLDGRRLHRGPIAPDLRVLLEDLRMRSDFQHPFWAAVRKPAGT